MHAKIRTAAKISPRTAERLKVSFAFSFSPLPTRCEHATLQPVARKLDSIRTALATVSVPGSLTQIGDGAFYGCSGITGIRYEGTQSQWAQIGIGPNNDNLFKINKYKLGDVNKDGKINSSDARLLLRISARLTEETDVYHMLGDVNEDGKLNSTDARTVLRISAKLIPAPEKEISIFEFTV